MTPLERIEEVRTGAEALVAEIKASLRTLSVADARLLYHCIREVEGWLQSSRALLEPEGIL